MTFSVGDTASLHGKLVHISCISSLIHPFLHSISSFASSFKSPWAKLLISLAAHADWVLFLMRILPNKIPLAPAQPVAIQWWGDTSTSFGVGIALGCHWAVWKWAPGFKIGPLQDYNIGWAEVVAIELSLHLALDLGLLGKPSKCGHTFLVHLDNARVVSVTNKGRSCSHKTNKILKHMYLLQA